MQSGSWGSALGLAGLLAVAVALPPVVKIGEESRTPGDIFSTLVEHEDCKVLSYVEILLNK
ncbi:hypothetical protein NQ315_000774 [Exocentrus adspersus]|uniref:Uncharacterized protein n=1 Tax=Exocentrus adspersus TaxID=1586481 RepID=A0AAV8WDD4_9CUCU|nr:hypothetical protein NQ315_000774 [Exocentrus adspersus]